MRAGGETVQVVLPTVKLSGGGGAVVSTALSLLAMQGKLWAGMSYGSSSGTRGRGSGVVVAASSVTGDAGKEGVTRRVIVPGGVGREGGGQLKRTEMYVESHLKQERRAAGDATRMNELGMMGAGVIARCPRDERSSAGGSVGEEEEGKSSKQLKVESMEESWREELERLEEARAWESLCGFLGVARRPAIRRALT